MFCVIALDITGVDFCCLADGITLSSSITWTFVDYNLFKKLSKSRLTAKVCFLICYLASVSKS